MEPARRIEIVNAYRLRAAQFDEIARRRARRGGPPVIAVPDDAQPRVLSPRELEVLGLVAEGYTSKEIGLTLHVAEETVKSHVTSVLARLDARNRAHAVALALRANVLLPPQPLELIA
jgi:DNA-binding CsgD family transcriptional regulator